MKLVDHLRAAGLNLPKMPVIIADEVARQIDELPTADSYSHPPDQYGTIAPPFPEFFVEATTEALGRTVMRGAHLRDITAVGSLVEPAGTHWTLGLSAYMMVDGRELAGYGAVVFIHISKDGRLLDDTSAMRLAFDESAIIGRRLQAGLAAGHVPYALKAVAAMHQRCPVEHVTYTRQQKRHAQRRHKVALSDYYILKVKPATPSEFERVGEPAQAPRRQHVVRGHFRYYTEERPLFGRTSGMVWVPDHERGSDKAGKIDKDYEV